MIRAFIYIFVIAIFISCTPDGGGRAEPPPPTDVKGKIAFKLTDDPGSFAYFKIDIAGIDYNVSADPNITTGWVEMTAQNIGIIDIINYSNGRELPLGAVELLPDTVNQLRIRFGTRNSFAIWSGPPGGNFAFFDMALHPSIVNGLVIPYPVKVLPNNTKQVYLDFNASTSRVQTGPTSWQFLPTVRVFESTMVSALEGYVQPKEAKPYVRVIYLNHSTATDHYDTAYGYPDQTGYFKILGLAPNRAIPDSVSGLQKVEYFPRLFPPQPYQPQDKNVVLAPNTTVNAGTVTLVQ